MWTAEDKEFAQRAAQALAKLQRTTGPKVLQELEAIRDQVANKRSNAHERAEAWLSVYRLVKRLDEMPGAEEIPGLWHRAMPGH
jgi:hypothetical protein